MYGQTTDFQTAQTSQTAQTTTNYATQQYHYQYQLPTTTKTTTTTEKYHYQYQLPTQTTQTTTTEQYQYQIPTQTTQTTTTQQYQFDIPTTTTTTTEQYHFDIPTSTTTQQFVSQPVTTTTVSQPVTFTQQFTTTQPVTYTTTATSVPGFIPGLMKPQPAFKLLRQGSGISPNEQQGIVSTAMAVYQSGLTPISNNTASRIKKTLGGDWLVIVYAQGKPIDFNMTCVQGNDYMYFTLDNTAYQVCRLR
jgi:hypothetical protein